MKKIEEIKELLSNIIVPQDGYNLSSLNDFLWGKGSNGEIVFGFLSKKDNFLPLTEITRHLKLYINTFFELKINNVISNKKISLLILKTVNEKYVDIFISLILSMAYDLKEEKLLRYFLELKTLFSNERKTSQNELEGMYGELFTIVYLKQQYDIDISKYYQKEDKRKFDFSITDKKKIEIKTTLKPERIHHFLHQQLDTDRFDIKVISLMIQKDDKGMSLLDIINTCKQIFSNNFQLILHIEMMIKNIDKHELEDIKFNYGYTHGNFKIFDALSLPKIKEKNVDGVFNVEYDVDFTNVVNENINSFEEWILK